MKNIFALMFLMLFFVACNKDGSTECTPTTVQAEDGSTTSTDCTETTPPATGETTGATDGGTTTGGTTTGGTTTGGTTTGGTTTGGTTTGGTSTGGSTGTGLPNEAYTFDTNIEYLNANASQQDKFEKAVEIIKKVVATEEFRSKVLNHTYNGSKTYVDNGGYSNSQIYQKILDGAEKLRPTKNNAMDMEVELYYAATSTVGYTYANVTKIWVNTKFFNTYTPSSVAANLFHEWLHKVGFGHASSATASRPYSVPYAIGSMIRTLGKQYE